MSSIIDEKRLEELAEELVKDVRTEEDLADPLSRLMKMTIEKALNAELTSHLGYEKHSSKGRNGRNSRNGFSSKKIKTDTGEIEISTPRDRDSGFEPQLVQKGQRRLLGFDKKILALYAKGQTTRDIATTIKEMYDVDVSHTLISQVTDSVLEEVEMWQITDSSYIVYDPNKGEKTGFYFTEYNLAWDKIYSEFGAKDFLFLKDNEEYYYLTNGNRLNLIVLSENKVFVTPKYFSGLHFLFERRNQKWHGRKIKTTEFKYPALTKISYNEYKKSKLSNKIKASGQKFSYSGIFNNKSVGVVNYKDKYILNFCLIRLSKNEYNYAVEIISMDGKLLNYQILNKFRQTDFKKYNSNIIGYQGNTIYCSSFDNEVYGLKAYSLKAYSIEIINK